MPLLAAAVLAGCGTEEPWNVVLITLDTTRADYLGCYGNQEVETPNIDGLAEEGVRFANAFSAIPLTTPSHSTLLTGLYPFGHGVRDNGSFVLPESQLTLAEILAEAGFRTGAAVASFPLVRRFGLSQGFSFFDDHVTRHREDIHGEPLVTGGSLFFDERPAGEVNDAIMPWIEEQVDEPFFAWVHYYDPHHPLRAPAPYDQLYADDPYAAEIAYVDESVGVLLAQLKRLGVYERTVIVVTADHGEGLGEHQEATHSYLLYDSTLHVPLIVRTPTGRQDVVVTDWVSAVDLVPTLLDLLKLEAPEGLHGLSLAHYSIRERHEVITRPMPIYAETLSPRLSHGWGELRALMEFPHKFIYGPRPELFDLESDPREQHDLSADEPDLTGTLERRLSRLLSNYARPPSDAFSEIDEEALEMLRSLGYVGDSSGDMPVQEKLRRDGTPPQDRAADNSAWSQSRQLLARGSAMAARSTIQPLLDQVPTNRRYLEVAVLSEIQLGNIERSIALLDRIRDHHDLELVNPAVPLGIADLLARRGDLEASLGMLELAQKIRSTAESWYMRAHIEQVLGRGEPHRQALREALRIEPTFVPAQIALAVAHAQDGELERAERELREALKDQPYLSTAWYNLGVLSLERGEPSGALDSFRRATQLRPEYAKAQLALLSVAMEANQLEEARSAFNTLQSLSPESQEMELARELLGEVR